MITTATTAITSAARAATRPITVELRTCRPSQSFRLLPGAHGGVESVAERYLRIRRTVNWEPTRPGMIFGPAPDLSETETSGGDENCRRNPRVQPEIQSLWGVEALAFC